MRGAAVGAADGAVAGISQSLYMNGDLRTALADGAFGAMTGGLVGGVGGGVFFKGSDAVRRSVSDIPGWKPTPAEGQLIRD